MLSFKRYDKYGQEIFPGDVCARSKRDKIELIVYKGDAYGRTNKYGRFISPEGQITVKFTSVAFAFDPMGSRRSKANQVNELVQQYYEKG